MKSFGMSRTTRIRKVKNRTKKRVTKKTLQWMVITILTTKCVPKMKTMKIQTLQRTKRKSVKKRRTIQMSNNKTKTGSKTRRTIWRKISTTEKTSRTAIWIFQITKRFLKTRLKTWTFLKIWILRTTTKRLKGKWMAMKNRWFKRTVTAIMMGTALLTKMRPVAKTTMLKAKQARMLTTIVMLMTPMKAMTTKLSKTKRLSQLTKTTKRRTLNKRTRRKKMQRSLL
mmetsp:Transcript_13731/g.24508  ORF Transcript_13731/g.24508 Transcript_13731/m.24508 type:complete len:226 (-) Transcript_13731:408-1085(-)